MQVIVHDFSGHPFQAELARKLAADGHSVRHVSADQYVSGKGHLEVLADDPATLTFDQIRIALPFQKYAPLARVRWELAYGSAWAKYARRFPDAIVIMCNVPLFAMLSFVTRSRLRRRPWVFWHQDIYSQGLAEEARRKLPKPAAAAAARVFERLEAWYARRAAAVVAIGEAFTKVYPRWRVDPKRVSVIPNWAPLDKIVPVERDNHRTTDVFGDGTGLRLLYAGTLGRKHNPLLLVELVRRLQAIGVDTHLTVVTEGEAADDLQAAADAEPSLGMRILPFQPAADLSAVLGSADVLIALLEPDATLFSIPSKVLSYLAAGRPVAGLMPADNPAAVDIVAAGGFVADPTTAGTQQVAVWLSELTADRIDEIGKNSRALAEEKFDLSTISERFTEVLAAARAGR